MTELTRKADPGLIARRYAAERRFRLYGVAALVLTTAFLFVLAGGHRVALASRLHRSITPSST